MDTLVEGNVPTQHSKDNRKNRNLRMKAVRHIKGMHGESHMDNNGKNVISVVKFLKQNDEESWQNFDSRNA